jgi:hypothetical protein
MFLAGIQQQMDGIPVKKHPRQAGTKQNNGAYPIDSLCNAHFVMHNHNHPGNSLLFQAATCHSTNCTSAATVCQIYLPEKIT